MHPPTTSQDSPHPETFADFLTDDVNAAGDTSPKFGVVQASSFATVNIKNFGSHDLPVGAYLKIGGQLNEITEINGDTITYKWYPGDSWLHWQGWADFN